MRKKMLALILCLTLVIPAVACGSGSTGAEQGQAEETAEETAEEEEPVAETEAAEPAAEEEAQEAGAVEVTEADLSGKLSSLDSETTAMPAFKEAMDGTEIGEEDSRANEELPSLLKVNDSTAEVEASLQSNMQALSYGGVIFQVPTAWQWETTQQGYLMTYPQDGHCYIAANGTGIRGYDSASLMNALKDGLSGEGQTVSEFAAGGKSGLKAEYYGNVEGINVRVTDYYFLPNDTWLLQMTCVSTTTESFDGIMQTLDFTYAVLN